LDVEYDTIRYDTVYLMCSKKLTCNQLSLPNGTEKIKRKRTKHKPMRIVTLKTTLVVT